MTGGDYVVAALFAAICGAIAFVAALAFLRIIGSI